jgi:MinD-like ATPase involved in chromosome partitioning or flagellar assembly/CheY-like chemotaxis protein
MPDRKILIIDANAESRGFIARTLSQQKYEIIQASSGKEGLVSAWRDRPDLVVMDPVLADMPGEEVARKIKSEPSTANMPLVALSSDPSLERLKACRAAGFSEYIVKSSHAVATLYGTINRLFGIRPATPAFAPTPTTPIPPSIIKGGGMLITILSAKGGVGTSTLSANIAVNIAQNEPEARVMVMDLVLPIGSIAPIVGYNGEQNLVGIADMPSSEATPDFFRDQLAKVKDWKIHLLAGSPDPDSSNRLNVMRIWSIVSALKMSYDYVLIDIGRSLSKFSLPLIQQADLVTMIVNPDLSTVTLTKTLLEYLKGKGVEPESIFPILNRVVGLEGLNKADVEQMLGVAIKFIIPHLGGNFTVSNNSHRPFSTQFPTDAASFLLRDIAREISQLTHEMRG